MGEFQRRLKAAMDMRNMKAVELSQKSGVGKSDISNYLRGVYNAKQDKILLLARALEVDPGWLSATDQASTVAEFDRCRELIKAKILQLNLSPAELSSRSGVPHHRIELYLNGVNRTINHTELVRICELLNIDYYGLIAPTVISLVGTHEEQGSDLLTAEILRLVKPLSDSKKKAIIELLRTM